MKLSRLNNWGLSLGPVEGQWGHVQVDASITLVGVAGVEVG